MNNKRTLCDTLALGDSDALDELIGSFGEDAELEKEAKQRILSSVMRKAGYEMDIKVTTKKRSKRFIGFMAAAVIAVTGAIGAGAAYIVNHQRSIDSIFGESSGELLERRRMINGTVYKGKHFDISIDTALSDGEMLMVIATAVPNDDYGIELIERGEDCFDLNTKIPFGSQKLKGGQGGSSEVVDGNVVFTMTTMTDRFTDSFTLPVQAEYFDSRDNSSHKIKRFDITFEKNLDAVDFVSESGDVLSLCDIGYHGINVTLGEGDYDVWSGSESLVDITFEYTDGSSEVFGDWSHTTESTKNGTYYYYNVGVNFSKIIDSSRVTAMTVNGIRFERSSRTG